MSPPNFLAVHFTPLLTISLDEPLVYFSFSPSYSQTQVQDFIHLISGSSSLYGLQPETLDSLVLSMLPPLTHSYEPLNEPRVMDSNLDLKVLMMQELLQNLRHCAGFHIPPVSTCSTRMKATGPLFFSCALQIVFLSCSALLMSCS